MEGIICAFSLKVSARDRLLAQPNSTYKESDKGFVIIGKRRMLALSRVEDAVKIFHCQIPKL